MSTALEKLSHSWLIMQWALFLWLNEELGGGTEKHQQLVTTLEVIRLEKYLSRYWGYVWRPSLPIASVAPELAGLLPSVAPNNIVSNKVE